MTVLYYHYSLTSLLKGYFLVPLLFEKSERDTGLTKWLCTPGNRSTETAGRIWADNKVPSATFSAGADSKDEEDLVKVLDAEDPLAALASGWRIDEKKPSYYIPIQAGVLLYRLLNQKPWSSHGLIWLQFYGHLAKFEYGK